MVGGRKAGGVREDANTVVATFPTLKELPWQLNLDLGTSSCEPSTFSRKVADSWGKACKTIGCLRGAKPPLQKILPLPLDKGKGIKGIGFGQV